MIFGKSFILSLIIDKLLPLGADYAKNLLEGNSEALDAFIKSIVPGEWLDEAVTSFIHGNVKLILEKLSHPKDSGQTTSSILKDVANSFHQPSLLN